MSRVPLPIDSFLPQIIDSLRAQRCLVLVAEPGAGKTTRVPPALICSGVCDGKNNQLVMLQPRRVAARASAARIAEENNWSLGNEVGYEVRFERRVTASTRLRVVTEGILVRQLVDDPFLDGVGCVVLDEFHERSIHSDVCLALLRELQRSGRDDLKIIVMSATLDAESVATYLDNAPIVNVPGRTFPVKVGYLNAPATRSLDEQIASAVDSMLPQTPGDLLIFLPGAREIHSAERALGSIATRNDLLICPLYGSLPFEQQQRALRPAHQRKVILATNIAETSLTIPGVTGVIDSALARVASYDIRRGFDRLDLQRISKASAKQRAGRAGRTQPGVCQRLITEKEFHALGDFDRPEIHRVDLAPTVLQLHGWGQLDARAFGWFDRPSDAALTRAGDLLALLGALKDGQLTAIGQRMCAVPAHPRLARLLIEGADCGLLHEAATLAAMLSERDQLPEMRGHEHQRARSDLLLWRDEVGGQEAIRRAREQFIRAVENTPSPRPSPTSTRARGQGLEDDLLKMILLAFPDRVCRRRENDPTAAAMVGGGGVVLARESAVKDASMFVALDARQIERVGSPVTLVTMASAIEEAWLSELFPDRVEARTELRFDPSTQRVIGASIVCFRDLLLRDTADQRVDPVAAGAVLADALRGNAVEWLQRDETAASVLARLELLRRLMPEHAWPTIDAQSILEEACRGKRSVSELENVLLAPVVLNHLHYPLDRLLESEAPTHLAVPSGSRVALTYSLGQPPVLAVRLQELFGWTSTPRIAGGRVPVVLHLLGPNYRPVQVTDDLKSFWATTYFQVRKDLRVRYPKHSWPDDPLTALPQAKGRPRAR